MEHQHHTCPVWVGYLMASPLRKLQQNPYKILKPYLQPGMQVLEIGPAMGFFSIPMAKMVQPKGKIFCIDLQTKMLEKLAARAHKHGVAEQIHLHQCSDHSLELESYGNSFDFCLLAFVVHEVPDQRKLFMETALALKKGAIVLFLEPRGHVKESAWKKSIIDACDCGFRKGKVVQISGARAVELIKI